jgi:rubrerythrin
MIDLDKLAPCELLALGRRALELCARRLDGIAEAADPEDRPLRALLQRMSLDQEIQAASVEDLENGQIEESRLPSKSDEAASLLRSHLTSLSKGFGEGPLNRDMALFYAESVEEEASRLFRVLASHARESASSRLFAGLSDHERDNLHHLREVVFQA